LPLAGFADQRAHLIRETAPIRSELSRHFPRAPGALCFRTVRGLLSLAFGTASALPVVHQNSGRCEIAGRCRQVLIVKLIFFVQAIA